MKKLFFIALVALFAATANAQDHGHGVDRTSEIVRLDTSFTGTVTNGINTNWGSATDRVVTVQQPNGNVVTLVPVYKGNKVQGWDVVITDRTGKTVYTKSYGRKKYQDAYSDFCDDYYGYGVYPRRRGIFGNFFSGVWRYGNLAGSTINGSFITTSPNGGSAPY